MLMAAASFHFQICIWVDPLDGTAEFTEGSGKCLSTALHLML